ncbi:MAG: hypothetical protein ACK5NT_03275 [Pyrinomonadaceae bacterium]
MKFLKMVNFCKSPACPKSQTLLNLAQQKLDEAEAAVVLLHLADCDFCAAEFELYTDFPENEEPITTAEIPTHLFELAEVLLSNDGKTSKILDKLLEDESGKLKDCTA